MRKEAIITFIIFIVFGGIASFVCRCLMNYVLYSRFFNERFILEIVENFSSVTAFTIVIIENLLVSAVFSIFPTVYLYQLKKINITFVLTYSMTIYLIGAIGVAFYLNLARVTLPLSSILYYVLLAPFFYVILPIWFAYSVFRIYWLAHSQMKF